MKVPLNSRFRAEAERYELAFCCEDCCFLDRSNDRCAHGWPNAVHRLSYYAQPNVTEVIFCKEFELL